MKPILGFAAVVFSAILSACSPANTGTSGQATPTATPAAIVIPASLAPFGDGYPKAGDPCRRLGESPTTIDWLDDSAALVGCPDRASADALGGSELAIVEGVIVKSIPGG